MKVVYVIDSIADIKSKIDLLENRFGKNLLFVVKANLVPIFQTYGYNINAVYSNDLPKVIHNLLARSEYVENVIYCKSSLKIDNKILNKFISTITKNPDKVVNIVPSYNFFENIGNSVYNWYVKTLFKTKDSLASPKLQYLPLNFVTELLSTHFANKLFEIDPEFCVNIVFEEKETNKNLKEKVGFNKNHLIPLIVFLSITIALFTGLVFVPKINYIFCLIFVFLYSLDLLFTIIYQCKLYFDERIFK